MKCIDFFFNFLLGGSFDINDIQRRVINVISQILTKISLGLSVQKSFFYQNK